MALCSYINANEHAESFPIEFCLFGAVMYSANCDDPIPFMWTLSQSPSLQMVI